MRYACPRQMCARHSWTSLNLHRHKSVSNDLWHEADSSNSTRILSSDALCTLTQQLVKNVRSVTCMSRSIIFNINHDSYSLWVISYKERAKNQKIAMHEYKHFKECILKLQPFYIYVQNHFFLSFAWFMYTKTFR